jgi:hypothetical protein
VQNRISDNVGGVKHFSSPLLDALEEERDFALAEKQLPVLTQARSYKCKFHNEEGATL